MSRLAVRLPAILTILLLIAGCDTSDPDARRTAGGVDLDVLFAPPTEAEKMAVLQEWADRDVAVTDVQDLVSVDTLVGGVAVNVRVLRHRVGEAHPVGAIIAPAGASMASLPILTYLHGGDGGVDLDDEVLPLLSFVPDVRDQYVLVVPSFRGEDLSFRGATYHSEGAPSPWDRDVDDALALMNVAIATTAAADGDRLAVLGFSRGAGVGLLMAVRDPRIDVLVEFFGPTDFYGPFVQDVVADALRGDTRDLPGFDVLNDRFIQPLRRGDLGIDDVRAELTRRSPVLFADRLPDLQIHHGTDDTIVPVSQAEALIAALQQLGRTLPAFDARLYDGGRHDPLSLPGSIPATVAFLSRVRHPTVAAR